MASDSYEYKKNKRWPTTDQKSEKGPCATSRACCIFVRFFCFGGGELTLGEFSPSQSSGNSDHDFCRWQLPEPWLS